MLIIPVKEGENIDRAVKRFKKKFDKTGTMRQLRKRKQYIKPSVRKREQLKKAIYSNEMFSNMQGATLRKKYKGANT